MYVCIVFVSEAEKPHLQMHICTSAHAKRKHKQQTTLYQPKTKQQPPKLYIITKTKLKQPMKLLLTMDVLVPVLMKNAANRDK